MKANRKLLAPPSKNKGHSLVSATLSLAYGSKNVRELEALRRAIIPETRYKGKCLLKVGLKKKGKKPTHLVLNFSSQDLAALRASMNTNCRLVLSAIKSLGALNSPAADPSSTEKD